MIETITIPFKTTIYHKSINNTKPLLVLIPGNPGFIEYYTEYLDLLSDLTGFEILGISHAGFCTDDPTSKIYSLEDQIQHKVDVLNEYVEGDRPVYIMGHSVGSWIMQRIVDRTKFNYKFIGFITPTIVDIHKSTKGSVLHPIVSNMSWFYKFVGTVSKALNCLPNSIITYLINSFINTEFQGAKDITNQFISNYQFVEQSLGLATEEMLRIQSDWEYQNKFFNDHKSVNKWIFFTSPDHWVNDETQANLEKLLKDDKRVLLDRNNTLRHSFCISQSELFAETTNRAFNHYS